MREPYTCIAYIAARTPLPKLLNIKHPDCDCDGLHKGDYSDLNQLSSLYVACNKCNLVWTAWMICEGLIYSFIKFGTYVSLENLLSGLVTSCRESK